VRRHALGWCSCIVALVTTCAAHAAEGDAASDIVRVSGVKSGLVVHVGVTDGVLTAELARGGKFLVHGLAADAASVEKAREHIRKLGSYGRISVERGSLAELPYADGLVNLLIVEDPDSTPPKEVLRVLVPNGVAILGTATPKIIRKPRPKEMDDWTHYNHGPDGNRVSQDRLVGPPQRIQWLAGADWVTLSNGPAAMVSSGGRLYYVLNEAPARRPKESWPALIARDAYNGLLLWRKPLTGRSASCQSMIADGATLYAAIKDSFVAVDGATGEVTRTYREAGSPAWAVLHQGSLLVFTSGSLRCIDAKTGKLRWKLAKPEVSARGPTPNLACDGDSLYFYESPERALSRIDLATGAEKWKRNIAAELAGHKGRFNLCSYQSGTIILGGDAVYAFSAKDGSKLWRHTYRLITSGGSRHKASSYVEGFFIDGLYWTHVGRWDETRGGQGGLSWQGLDPKTGHVKKTFTYPKSARIGDSCHRDQATVRYFMGAYIDFMETATGTFHYGLKDLDLHAGCGFGALPANGLLYTCSMYTDTYLRGDMALRPAPATGAAETERRRAAASPRLEKGPAYNATPDPKLEARNSSDWPTYRHDPARTGRVELPVPAQIEQLWAAGLADRIAQPTVVGDTIFVALPDELRVVALDARTGNVRWTHVAGGKVLVSPTYYRGLCLFGSADGWVYCVRASDGALAWRFRAAPTLRRIVGRERVASPSPVNAGVLVVNGPSTGSGRAVACFAAGRTGRLDEGVAIYALDAATGKLVWSRERVASPVVRLIAAEGPSVGISGKTRFNLKDGGVGRRPALPPAAFHDGLLDPTHVVGAGDRKRKRYPIRVRLPVSAKAMVRAADTVFVAGRPITPYRKRKPPTGDDFRITWAEARNGIVVARAPENRFRAYEATLWIFSAEDGRLLRSVKLDAPLVFDGMAAANGKLYLCTQDGKLRCFGKKEKME